MREAHSLGTRARDEFRRVLNEARSVFRRVDGVCGTALQRDQDSILAPQRLCPVAQNYRRSAEILLAEASQADVVTVTTEQLAWLLDGYDIWIQPH